MLAFFFRTCALILLPFSFAVAEPDPASTGTILGDARLIITSNKGDVRLWAHPPKVLVLSDKPVKELVLSVAAQIEEAVNSPFGEKLFGDIRFEEVPDDLGTGQDRIWSRVVRGGSSGYQVGLNLGNGFVHQTDILIVVADRPTVAIMNGLWGLDGRNGRAQLQGGLSRCFYESSSRVGVRLAAYVSIFQPPDENLTKECLWEELLHTLGPLIDASGSSFFSFDDQADSKSILSAEEQSKVTKVKRANDLLLIRALYESGVEPGGSPDIVIDYLEKLLTLEGE